MPTQQSTADTAQDSPALIVFDHPLIAHKMATIRDQATNHRFFRAHLSQIAGLMVYEVTRSFKTKPIPVQTPVTSTTAQQLVGTITIVPVLRAGLGMIHGMLEVMPEARVGHLGLEPIAYLNKLPKDLDAGPVILVDPMLATGGSASAALTMLKDAGATDLRMICLVAAPEGVARLHKDHPDITIYCAALDERLDERGYIVPGLGDAGDRMYGTV